MTDEELALRARDGDSNALLDLWNQKRGLVYTFASKRYSTLARYGMTRGTELEDMMQCGFLALMRAVNYYDPQKPFAFSTYLGNTVKTEFDYLLRTRDHSKIDALDNATSLDAPMTDEQDGNTLENMIADTTDCFAAVEDKIFQEQQHDAIERVLSRIPENQKAAVRLRYFEGLSLKESAEKMGKTYNQLRVLMKNAMAYLRSPDSRAELEQYVDFQTNFYYHGNVKRQESPVEALVERRENLRARTREKG